MMKVCDNMINGRKRKEGFTLVELSLSIAFIAVLSLAVALIITNSISAYHRGLVLNQINTTGMELVDDMRAAIQNAPVISLKSLCDTWFEGDTKACKDANGQGLVVARKSGNVKIGNEKDGKNRPLYGVFCTGNYSYIWNSGYHFNNVDFKVTTSKAELRYRDISGNYIEKKDFRLLKVKDEKRAVCVAYNNSSNVINISDKDRYGVITEDPIELLPSDGGLALYDLYAPAPAVNAGMNNIYYSVSFVLGTLQGGADVASQGNYCTVPEELKNSAIENFDYCAINKFNFAAQAVGGGE